jgi:hypothetical protein
LSSPPPLQLPNGKPALPPVATADRNSPRHPKRRRTDPQNRYYWGVVVEAFARDLRRRGWRPCDPLAAHAIFKKKFLPPGFFSTTRLGTIHFARYVERCRRWLREEWEVFTPDPAH